MARKGCGQLAMGEVMKQTFKEPPGHAPAQPQEHIQHPEPRDPRWQPTMAVWVQARVVATLDIAAARVIGSARPDPVRAAGPANGRPSSTGDRSRELRRFEHWAGATRPTRRWTGERFRPSVPPDGLAGCEPAAARHAPDRAIRTMASSRAVWSTPRRRGSPRW